jgi:hypothetical protein
MARVIYKTVAGLALRRTVYLGDPAWTDEKTGRIIFWLDCYISVPAPRGSHIRSGRYYSPKWKCELEGKSWPYIGAWFETITEIVERLDREGAL